MRTFIMKITVLLMYCKCSVYFVVLIPLFRLNGEQFSYKPTLTLDAMEAVTPYMVNLKASDVGTRYSK